MLPPRSLPQTPQAYTLGNLARAGYGATEEGVFPYSYNSCDVGIFPNQTTADRTTPAPDGALSYLRGQKLSACPCRAEEHPNPLSDMRGRGAPQIDILNVESTASTGAEISQTLRFAPRDAAYTHTATGTQVVNATVAKVNDYQGRIRCVALFPFTILPLRDEADIHYPLWHAGKRLSRLV